jgi:hypothetical protein
LHPCPQARTEASRALQPDSWHQPFDLARLAADARAPGWRAAALSLFASACRLAAAEQGGGLLLPLAELHGCRLRWVAEAAAALRGGGGGGGDGNGGSTAAEELLRLAARHCFTQDAAERLARLPAGDGRSRAAAAGADSRTGALGDAAPAPAAGWAAAAAVLEADCCAALRFCQDRYAAPGQLHTATYYLAHGLALMGR